MAPRLPSSAALVAVCCCLLVMQVDALWPGLAFAPPQDTEPGDHLNGASLIWNVINPSNGSEGTDYHLGSAVTCEASQAFGAKILEFINKETTTLDVQPQDDQCELSQTVHIDVSQGFCHEEDCPSITFVYDLDAVLNFARNFSAVLSYQTRFMRQQEFLQTRPKEAESPLLGSMVNEFHFGTPILEFAVTTESQDSKPQDFTADMSASEPLRAFLIVTQHPDFDTGYNMSALPCQEDCSCAARDVFFRYEYFNRRRRLERAARVKARQVNRRRLQTSDCLGVGMSPEYNYTGSTCCEGLIPCHRFWPVHEMNFTRCVASQTLCDEGRWRGEYDITPDPVAVDQQNISDIWEGFATCPDYQSCNSSVACRETLMVLEGLYDYNSTKALSSRESFITFLQDTTSTVGMPLWLFLQCVLDGYRLEHVWKVIEDGGDIDESTCLAEIDACWADEFCSRLLVIKMFAHDFEQELFFYWLAQAYDTQSVDYGAKLLDAAETCTINIGKSLWWFDYGQILTIPLDEVPCACNGSAINDHKMQVDVLGTGQGVEMQSMISFDLCHASSEELGRVQVQRVDVEKYNVIGKNFSAGVRLWGADEWRSALVNLPTGDTSLLDCLANNFCTSEEMEIRDKLLFILNEPQNLAPPEHVCDWNGKSWSHWHPHVATYSRCRVIQVSASLEDMSKSISATGAVPQALLRFMNVSSWGPSFVFEFETTDEDNFATVELTFETSYGLDAYYAIQGTPVVPPGLTRENCHDSCNCHLFALSESWSDAVMNDELKNNTAFVRLENVPCACDIADFSQPERKIRTEMAWGYEQKLMLTTMRLCAPGAYFLVTNFGIDPDNGGDPYDGSYEGSYDEGTGRSRRQWNWVCDCDLSKMTHMDCIRECEDARGPWGWTCSVGQDSGFHLITENEVPDYQHMCE